MKNAKLISDFFSKDLYIFVFVSMEDDDGDAIIYKPDISGHMFFLRKGTPDSAVDLVVVDNGGAAGTEMTELPPNV